MKRIAQSSEYMLNKNSIYVCFMRYRMTHTQKPIFLYWFYSGIWLNWMDLDRRHHLTGRFQEERARSAHRLVNCWQIHKSLGESPIQIIKHDRQQIIDSAVEQLLVASDFRRRTRILSFVQSNMSQEATKKDPSDYVKNFCSDFGQYIICSIHWFVLFQSFICKLTSLRWKSRFIMW